jgi:hypothetical protein
MSMTTESFLAIHRAIWFSVLYAMGLEGQSVEVMDRNFRYRAGRTAAERRPAAGRRQPLKRKAT